MIKIEKVKKKIRGKEKENIAKINLTILLKKKLITKITSK